MIGNKKDREKKLDKNEKKKVKWKVVN